MTKQIAEGGYKNFSPTERIALFYEAMARRDYDEADRLIETCPTKTYRCMDTSYGEGVRVLHEGCFCTRLLIEQASSRMFVAGALLAAYADRSDGGAEFSKYADAYANAVGAIRGYWEGWNEFCSSVGVNPDAVMRAAWAGLPHCVEHPLMEEVDAEIEADPPESWPKAKAEVLSFLRGRWQTYQERTGPRYNRPSKAA